MGWIEQSPKVAKAQIEGAVWERDFKAFPVLCFAFIDEEGEPITASLICTERSLASVVKQLEKLKPELIKKSRARQITLNKERRAMEEEAAAKALEDQVMNEETARVAEDYPQVNDVG